MGLWMRILARYLIGGLAGVLVWIGLPPEVVEAVRNDPEIVAAVALACAGLIEWITTVARRKGWMT